MQTVPVVPNRLREDKYSNAVDAYLDDEIDEAELEREIEDALLGRIPFDEVLKMSELVSPHHMPDPNEGYHLYGVELEYGETIEPEETPNLFENPLVGDK